MDPEKKENDDDGVEATMSAKKDSPKTTSATPAQIEALRRLSARKAEGRRIAGKVIRGETDVPPNPLRDKHY